MSLTLPQPSASLTALGHKTTEIRRGPHRSPWSATAAIHAARPRPRRSEWNDRVAEAVADVNLPLGAVIATARVDGCVRILSNRFAELSEPADPAKVWVVDRLG